MAWNALISTASTNQTLERARKALGRGTVYKLGKGGMKPLQDLDHQCDCSGFVAWAIGIPRQLPPDTGGWLDTDCYCRGGDPVLKDLATPVSGGPPTPGDLYVYPDSTVNGKHHEGHIGIISKVENGTVTRVIHCSMSNSAAGDAVQETAPKAWINNPHAKVMRLDYNRLRGKFGPGGGQGGATPPQPSAPSQPSTAGQSVLKHPLLANDATLQRIAATGQGVLKNTGGQVAGAGAVQDALNRLSAHAPNLAVNLGAQKQFRGFFGDKTEAAVRNFQASHGLHVDGAVGRDTLRALDAALQAAGM